MAQDDAMTQGDGIRHARAELARIEGEIEERSRRREKLLAYIEVAEGMRTGVRSDGGGIAVPTSTQRSAARRPPRGDRAQPAPVVRRGAALDPTLRSGMIADRRAFLRGVVSTVLEILSRTGRPMSAAELHAALPQSNHVDRELLYRTLHKRIEQKKLVIFRDGAFWLRDVPWPADPQSADPS